MVNLAVAVSRATICTVNGVFHRHSSPRVTALSGSPAGGRWGPPGAFPVLYLGRPTISVTIEAYRHLVDGVEGMTGDKVASRTLWTCQVQVTNVLDLRASVSREAVGLNFDDLTSQVGEYTPCQQVAQAAYQLQLHGIIAPAAGGTGETLALFEHHLSPAELPVAMNRETWERLPADPRRLRSLPGGAASSGS